MYQFEFTVTARAPEKAVAYRLARSAQDAVLDGELPENGGIDCTAIVSAPRGAPPPHRPDAATAPRETFSYGGLERLQVRIAVTQALIAKKGVFHREEARDLTDFILNG